jgi:hypothetical protein
MEGLCRDHVPNEFLTAPPATHAASKRLAGGGGHRVVSKSGAGMAITVGAWIAFAGALAPLVGVTARRNVRRLRSTGVRAWATAVHRPVPDLAFIVIGPAFLIVGTIIAAFAP